MDQFSIIIQKNGEDIACVLFDTNTDTVTNLRIMKALIDSYNENLVGKNIPDVVLAHRFLEEENIDCSLHIFRSRIMPESYKFLCDEYPGYNFPESEEKRDFGVLSFTEKDMKESFEKGNYQALIDLDSKSIYLIHFFELENKSRYTTEEINDMNLYKIDFNPTHFYFNQLDELIEISSKAKVFSGELEWAAYKPK